MRVGIDQAGSLWRDKRERSAREVKKIGRGTYDEGFFPLADEYELYDGARVGIITLPDAFESDDLVEGEPKIDDGVTAAVLPARIVPEPLLDPALASVDGGRDSRRGGAIAGEGGPARRLGKVIGGGEGCTGKEGDEVAGRRHGVEGSEEGGVVDVRGMGEDVKALLRAARRSFWESLKDGEGADSMGVWERRVDGKEGGRGRGAVEASAMMERRSVLERTRMREERLIVSEERKDVGKNDATHLSASTALDFHTAFGELELDASIDDALSPSDNELANPFDSESAPTSSSIANSSSSFSPETCAWNAGLVKGEMGTEYDVFLGDGLGRGVVNPAGESLGDLEMGGGGAAFVDLSANRGKSSLRRYSLCLSIAVETRIPDLEMGSFAPCLPTTNDESSASVSAGMGSRRRLSSMVSMFVAM